MSLGLNLANAAATPGGLAPVGVVLPFAGSAAPSGWLLCAGQEVSRTTYAALFTALGTAYGVGNGSTTFNLPDLRGRIPGGKDDMGGSAASRLNVTLTGTRGNTTTGTITGLSSTAGLAVGMRAIGTGIGTNAVITSIVSATSVTLSVNNTATGTGSIRFGVVDGATLGAVGGDHIHTISQDQMPLHSHNLSPAGGGGSFASGIITDFSISSAGSYATSSVGSGRAMPNIQPTMVLNYIIKH